MSRFFLVVFFLSNFTPKHCMHSSHSAFNVMLCLPHASWLGHSNLYLERSTRSPTPCVSDQETEKAAKAQQMVVEHNNNNKYYY
jgi:hypothetical protein